MILPTLAGIRTTGVLVKMQILSVPKDLHLKTHPQGLPWWSAFR